MNGLKAAADGDVGAPCEVQRDALPRQTHLAETVLSLEVLEYYL